MTNTDSEIDEKKVAEDDYKMPEVNALTFDDIKECLANGLSDFRQAPMFGFFFGGTYRIPLAERGSISLSSAYALMDGSYKDNCHVNEQNCAFNFDGSSSGVSLGSRYAYPFSDQLILFGDFKYQRYTFEGDDQTGRSVAGTSVEVSVDPAVEVVEEISIVSAGFNYVF